ncbi:hypothetical protein P7D22_22975, partial [Lichenihabitans sp. Uapishka_5]|nr:hypothetical protein [Lichenihabitans sp. Uapishka_5]
MNAPLKPPVSPEAFLDALFDDGLLIRTGVDGLYGRAGIVEEVIERFTARVAALAADDRATRIHFPPGLPRRTLEKSGYLKSFPQLAGCVHAFMGGDSDHGRLIGLLEAGEDWT